MDGVHATPHGPTDVRALGADFYATSAYKWSGPHIGAVIADPARLEALHPDKLAPAPDYVPDRFEHGTAPFADLAGVAAAVDHLASLADASGGSRRERVVAAMTAVAQYEEDLCRGDVGRAGRTARGDRLRRGPPAHRHGLLQRRRAHPAAGRRAPGRPAG